jgi:hypothetical protein
MTNPFDWKNYKSTISLKDLETSRRLSYQATRQANLKRLQNIEPSPSASFRAPQHVIANPVNMTVDIPEMTTYKIRKRKK